MILFGRKQKMCDNCKGVKTVKRFKCDEEYLAILETVKELLASGKYEMLSFNPPIDFVKDEKGVWADDCIWHTIKCKACNTVFTCSCDTYHGFGSFREGK